MNLNILIVKTFLLIISFAQLAKANPPYEACMGDINCDSEEVISIDNRPPYPVIQPLGDEGVMGLCGKTIPSSRSYKIQLGNLSCGTSVTEKKTRLPFPIDEEKYSLWSRYLNSSIADRREKAQKVRQVDFKWNSTVKIPMEESWSYYIKKGGYNSSRCRMEDYQATCRVSRSHVVKYCSETESHYRQRIAEEERQRRLEEERRRKAAAASAAAAAAQSAAKEYSKRASQNNGGSNYGSGGYNSNSGKKDNSYTPTRRPIDEGINARTDGARKSMQKFEKTGKSKRGSSNNEEQIRKVRDIADEPCHSWSSRTEQLSPYEYSCTKQRATWCEWEESVTTSRSCDDLDVKYNVEYTKDPNWKPGYTASTPERIYIDQLPNKFDLLPGELEHVKITVNKNNNGSTLSPDITIEEPWNEYKTSINPEVPKCSFNSPPVINIQVKTEGRIPRKAPNPLALPTNEDGSPVDALKFNEGLSKDGMPSKLILEDRARDSMLEASQISRQFGDRSDEIREVVKTDLADAEKPKDIKSFWVDTQFKFQVLRKDYLNRDVRVTSPEKFNSEKAIYDGKTISIALRGQELVNDVFRLASPVDDFLEGFWKMFKIELTPGQKYYLKIQTVQRGMPFYESGCHEGKASCQGEEASKDSYSEPFYVEWTAPKEIDNRSFWKKLRDFREHSLVF